MDQYSEGEKKFYLGSWVQIIRIGPILFFNGNNGREELTAFGFDEGSSLAINNNLVKYSFTILSYF